MKNEATVVEIRGTRAIVEARRLSACEGCHKNQNGTHECSVCSLMGGDGVIRAEAENPLGASVGDRVVIESGTGRMLWYAALVFMLPILLTLAVYALAMQFSESDGIRLLAATAAFVATFFGLFIYSRSVQKKRCDATIVEILENARREDLDRKG